MGMEADAMMQVDALIKKCGEINSSSINTHFAIRQNKQSVVFSAWPAGAAKAS